MDPSFWRQRWEKNEIAFHESKANPLLVKHFTELSLAKGSRVFVPLCGKTLDISWLLSNGYRVAGAELSQIAIEQLFMELGCNQKYQQLAKWSSGAQTISTYLLAIYLLCPERYLAQSMQYMTGLR